MSDKKQTLAESRAKKAEKKAEEYWKRYRPQFEALENSLVSKIKGETSLWDYWTLGQQLERFEEHYASVMEDQQNVNLLGKIPSVAFDVITAVQGVSIIPVIASVQPLEEEQGLVYFEKTRAGNTKGNLTAGDALSDPRTIDKTPENYANNRVEGEASSDVPDGVKTSFSYTLAKAPVKSQSLRVYLRDTPSIFAVDQGSNSTGNPDVGQLLGNGMWGTITYSTGAIALTVNVAPAGSDAIHNDYQENYELASDITTIDMQYDSKAVTADMYALKGTISLFHDFAMNKRFGFAAADKMATKLVEAINKEIGGKLIKRLRANAPASGVTFDAATVPTGISRREHFDDITTYLHDVEEFMTGNAGRGMISTIVAGREMAAKLASMTDFRKISDGSTLGPHIFGQLGNVTVVRVHDSALLAAKESVVMWKGSTPFEAPLVWAPYMPLTMTDLMPLSPNPLSSQRAAAVWAAADTIIPAYSATFDLTP